MHKSERAAFGRPKHTVAAAFGRRHLVFSHNHTHPTPVRKKDSSYVYRYQAPWLRYRYSFSKKSVQNDQRTELEPFLCTDVGWVRLWLGVFQNTKLRLIVFSGRHPHDEYVLFYALSDSLNP